MSSELQTREQLFEVMEQIAEEREAAWPVVQQLLARKPEELEDIDIDPSWRTAGFVKELSEAAGKLWEPDPLRSLPLQQLALTIAMSIETAAYPWLVPRQLEGTSWWEIGCVHRAQNATEPALRAYRAAEDCFAREPLLMRDAARSVVSRAITLAYNRRPDDATQLLDESEVALRAYNDGPGLIKLKFTRGLVEQRRGRLHSAQRQYEEVVSDDRAQDDLVTLASAYNNLGTVYRDLGRMNEAVLSVQRAREIDLEIGVPTDKADWSLALILITTGEYSKALPLLGRLRDNFLAKRMPQESGEAALDMVEVLIATDRYAEARTLTEQVLKEFVDAGLSQSAITALAYLRDLLPTEKEARRAVQHVRSHLQELRSEPSLVFLPLDDKQP